MSTSKSILEALLQALPHLRTQLYFKSSLTALSHAIEDQVLAGTESPLVIASFQRERFYRQEAHRYLRIAERTPQVYVLAAPETDFAHRSNHYEAIAFEPTDTLSQEWHLIVLGQQQSTCLVCREREATPTEKLGMPELPAMDQTRRFEGIWTFDRQVACQAAELLLKRIQHYRPELAQKITQARRQFFSKTKTSSQVYPVNRDPFADRLVTYLQAGQYKLQKAYRSIATQELKERLINSITNAIRLSLDPHQILAVAAQELGSALQISRCLIYRCKVTDQQALIQHEFRANGIEPLLGQTWKLQSNPLFTDVVARGGVIWSEDTQTDPLITDHTILVNLVKRWQITSWMLVPVLYQGRLLGMVELHHCGVFPHRWSDSELSLVEAIATQIGTALIQAESYAHLEDLNQQLAALDRTRSNLIAITGHELRTPLSTIQVCLESLASEPDMPVEVRQVMLNTALEDSQRMQELVQDFLTLSQLESGQVAWHLESILIQECIDLALSSVQAKRRELRLPQITTQIPPELPLVRGDGEWLVEVITKLLDNACKFTDPDGAVIIQAQRNGAHSLEVTIADTGRGIEPDRLEVIFDRFYQEEGALRRTTGGTGLGLAICRQIVTGLGGQIWAESAGKDRGSQFHFTLPIAEEQPQPSTSR
jgi:DICT domain-containing protein/signal transduction histidine kinase